MEAEEMALAHSCLEFLPIMDMVTSLGELVGLLKDWTTLHVSLHEYKAWALILAETLPHTPKWTRCHKDHLVYEEVVKIWITSVKINSFEHLGDMFIKAFQRVTFEYLRSKLMGW